MAAAQDAEIFSESEPESLRKNIGKMSAGRMELAQRTAAVHADAVLQHVGRLPCPYEQKRALLTAVLETVQST